MKKLLTLAEMSQATHRSPKALRVLMSRGKFPFVKIGGRIFGDPDEIDRFEFEKLSGVPLKKCFRSGLHFG